MLGAKLLEAFIDNTDISPTSSVLDVGCQSANALTWKKLIQKVNICVCHCIMFTKVEKSKNNSCV